MFCHCGQPGHRESCCEAKIELVKFGDYRHDIIEGRKATRQEREKLHSKSTADKKTKDDATKPTTSGDDNRTIPIAAENTVVTSKQEATSSTSGIQDIVSPPVSSKSPLVNTENTEDKPIVTVVIGDSNLKNIDTPLPGVHIQAESGATFLSTRPLMGLAAKKVCG